MFNGTSHADEKFQIKMVNDTPEPVYELRGDIDFGSRLEFERVVANRKGGWLMLDSIGGSLDDSIMIGWLIRDLGIKTYVRREDRCLSGCAIIWAAGAERWNEGGLNLAFHRPWREVDGRYVDGDQKRLRDYFEALGYSDAAIEKFMWRADSFYWLNAKRAKQLGIEAHFTE